MQARIFLALLAIISALRFSYGQTIAGGKYHSLAVCIDGTLMSWGSNSYSHGSLGDSTIISTNVPIQLTTLSGIIKVAAGTQHSLALKNDGTVWTWGDNIAYQLGGDSTLGQRNYPAQVNTLTGVADMAGGTYHSIALKNDGTVWAWGINDYHQLGDSTIIPKSTPVQVHTLTGIIEIASKSEHSLALKNDGTVWAWGHNIYGALGDSTLNQRMTPVQSYISGVIAVAAGWEHSLALKSDGTVWAWGANDWGQLGIGFMSSNGWTVPRHILSLTGVVAIAAGEAFSIALKNDGTVWTWGRNTWGQLGIGATYDSAIPVKITTLSGIIAIFAEHSHAFALKNDGTLWAWGVGTSGQLGDGANFIRIAPVQTTGLCPVIGYDEISSTTSEILIFPTQNDGEFTIEIPDMQSTIYILEIFNALGEKVYGETMSTTKKEIHLPNPRAGIYFVRVRSGENLFVKKMVVQP